MEGAQPKAPNGIAFNLESHIEYATGAVVSKILIK